MRHRSILSLPEQTKSDWFGTSVRGYELMQPFKPLAVGSGWSVGSIPTNGG